ncbi:chaperonin 10-like protein [Sphaerosporella brunnea]|uniref:Chaperonin 10-like protein n=1 Tax=Sphaerosporella brunnea TaxID=1250544 RepID=A0A5J5F5G8_9PEZI|nr:chaperonin 10-like protein [Sphaerosporella brunnea]
MTAAIQVEVPYLHEAFPTAEPASGHISSSSSSSTSSPTASPTSSTSSITDLAFIPTKALLLHSRSGPYELTDSWPRSTPNHGEVLIRNVCIGLNPIDWKSVHYGFGIHHLPWVSGRESSGIVEAVGPGVNRFKTGDRVLAPSTNYRDNRTSSFQEFSIALEANTAHIPEWLTWEDAASIGVAFVAASEALFNSLGLPRPYSQPGPPSASEDWLLIWGGASITGIMAIQLAKIIGLNVATVSSLHNTDYLRSYGADIVLDRHNPEEVVKALQSMDISMALDCVGAQTAEFAARALAENGRLVCLVQRPKFLSSPPKKGLEVLDVLIKRFHEDVQYGQELMELVERLLSERQLRTSRVKVLAGGFEDVETGLEKLRKNEISGEKVIVHVGKSVANNGGRV